ncbi:ATP-binding protein [Candidatus Saccharibacteria bacterium]|nr:ATP-binding protein [Candidatus Saccharibacteria bacterium]
MARIRRKYLDQIISTMGTEDIKVITGVRRSGKSVLLDDFKKYIKSNIEDANVISFDLSELKNEKLREYHALNDFVEGKYVEDEKNFLLIDEVQMCEGFELVLNSLHASHKYDIYITGSNAFLAGSDLATLFVGRTYTIEVFPFSFSEFMEYNGYNEKEKYDALEKYAEQGGMSGSYPYKTVKEKYDYLRETYDTLIVRDIEEKHGVKNPAVMDRLSDFLMDNISKPTSARNIANTLMSNHIEASNKTITEYIKYLCEAYAFYKVRRYDIKGKRYLASTDKYYLSDHAFKYAKLGTKTLDFGDIYENIVAIELMRRGYEVYVGAMRNSEIDFVAIKDGEKLYIQVSYLIAEEETMRREVAPLMNIPGGYQKLLIAGTRHSEMQYEGIHIVDIADWLLEKDDIGQ